jgi:hypothetical protein
MSKKKNPKLKEGDRVVLIYMPGEDIDTGTKGKVRKISQQPSFGTEFDYSTWSRYLNTLIPIYEAGGVTNEDIT